MRNWISSAISSSSSFLCSSSSSCFITWINIMTIYYIYNISLVARGWIKPLGLNKNDKIFHTLFNIHVSWNKTAVILRYGRNIFLRWLWPEWERPYVKSYIFWLSVSALQWYIQGCQTSVFPLSNKRILLYMKIRINSTISHFLVLLLLVSFRSPTLHWYMLIQFSFLISLSSGFSIRFLNTARIILLTLK